MGWGYALLLAVLQGIAEFLPISSSGHLAVAQLFLPGLHPDVAFDVLLHVGTMFAVLGYFRRDILGLLRGLIRPADPDPKNPLAGHERRTVGLLLVSTVATVVLAFPIRHAAEAAFHNRAAVGFFFLCTAALLGLCSRVGDGSTGPDRFPWWKAVLIGLAQGVAVFPGISRSGATIVACLILGMDRRIATRFSLLLSVPVIFGAFLLKMKDLDLSEGALGPSLAALLVTFAVGWGSIHLLVGSVRDGWFPRFGWYCGALGIAVLVLAWFWH